MQDLIEVLIDWSCLWNLTNNLSHNFHLVGFVDFWLIFVDRLFFHFLFLLFFLFFALNVFIFFFSTLLIRLHAADGDFWDEGPKMMVLCIFWKDVTKMLS